jgi:hypothetical protein
MPLEIPILPTKFILNTVILVRFLCISDLWELHHIPYVCAGFAVNLALLLVLVLAVAAFPLPRPFLAFPLSLPFLAVGFGAETEGPAETTRAESMRAEATFTEAESPMMREAEGESPAVREAVHDSSMASAATL